MLRVGCWLLLLLIAAMGPRPPFAGTAYAQAPRGEAEDAQPLLGWRAAGVEAAAEDRDGRAYRSRGTTLRLPELRLPAIFAPLQAAVSPRASAVGVASGGPLRQPAALPFETPTARPLATAGLRHGLAPTPHAADATLLDQRPLARLVRNPDTSGGAPPFALADEAGRVQRLVEPTVGRDLGMYVGQIVRVNHDTGATLLASQLELPSLPTLAPLPLGGATARGVATAQYTEAAPPAVVGGPAEPLPEPIVLEEVVGQPDGPVMGQLQFPPSVQPSDGQTVSPSLGAAPLPPSAGACVGCGSAVVGPRGQAGCGPGCALFAPGWALPSGGVDFSAEALWLRLHDSAVVGSGNTFEDGSRWQLGYTPAAGRRLTIRYLEYDTPTAAGGVDLETLDLEAQRWLPVGYGRVGLGAGVRWAEYSEAGALAYDDAFGPMLAVYGRAPLWGRTEALLTLRQSWQFGEASVAVPPGAGAPVGVGDNGTFSITEVQFGLERRRQIGAGEAFIRGVFETQYWNDVGQAVDDSTSRGLFGFGLGVGLRM